jgi:hypothetical protein
MKRKFLVTFVLSFLTALPATAEDFMDTRLSFVISENNFFAGPGETRTNSPGLGIGADRSNTLFFDNYDTRFSGFETMSHLALYKKMPAFFEHLTTEASLVVRFRIEGEKDEQNQIFDSGSYIRLIYDVTQGQGKDTDLELVLFPVSGDRFRLGYSYMISWGGSGIFPQGVAGENKTRVTENIRPAVKLQMNTPWGYGFVGFKTAQLQEHVGEAEEPEQIEMVMNYGVLGGIGVDIHGIRAEVNGGFFTRGTFQHQGVRGEPVYGYGVSYQVGYHRGMEIGTSIDFALYRNDPDMETKFFKPEEYGEGLSLVIKHEGSFLGHTLEDFDRYATTVNQVAMAFDLNFALKWGYFRAHVDIMYRTLSYLLFEVPGFTPYQDFPGEAKIKDEYFAAVGIDYHFPGLHLTPGIKIGVQMPATYFIEDPVVGGMTFEGPRTIVVTNESDRSVLPRNEEAMLIFALKANCKWDISETMAMIMEVYYTWDDNQTRYVGTTQEMEVMAQFLDPHILGMNLAVQARF